MEGWQSQTQISQDFGGNVVRVVAAGSSGAAITANTEPIDFTVIEDTSGSWTQSASNGDDTFTAPSTGDYVISGAVNTTANTPTLSIVAYVDSGSGYSAFRRLGFDDSFTACNFSGNITFK